MSRGCEDESLLCSMSDDNWSSDKYSEEVPSKISTMKSVRSFYSTDEYLLVMVEDLTEWMKSMYKDFRVTPDTFMDAIANGVVLCIHANNILKAQRDDFLAHSCESSTEYPTPITYKKNALPNTFAARDNVSNFIEFARTIVHVRECLMFESDDLILRKNVKNVVLCLLEVARYGAMFGMNVPTLIQLEDDIARQIRTESGHFSSFNELKRQHVNKCSRSSATKSITSSIGTDKSTKTFLSKAVGCVLAPNYGLTQHETKNQYNSSNKSNFETLRNIDEVSKLHQQVSEIVNQMGLSDYVLRLSEGKYSLRIPIKDEGFGSIIYIRLLRDHVMVNTGVDQWDTLQNYLEKVLCRVNRAKSGAADLRSTDVSTAGLTEAAAADLNNVSVVSDNESFTTVPSEGRDSLCDSAAGSGSLDGSKSAECDQLIDSIEQSSRISSSDQSVDSLKSSTSAAAADHHLQQQQRHVRPSAFQATGHEEGQRSAAAIAQLDSRMVSGIPVPRRLILKYRGSRTMPTIMNTTNTTQTNGQHLRAISRIPRLTSPRNVGELTSTCSTPSNRTPLKYKGAATEHITMSPSTISDSPVPYKVNKAYEWRKRALYFRHYMEETRKGEMWTSTRDLEFGKTHFHYSDLKGSEIIYGNASSIGNALSSSSEAVTGRTSAALPKTPTIKNDLPKNQAKATTNRSNFTIATSFL